MSEASELLERYNQNLLGKPSLNEMATIVPKSMGFGIELKIFSEDHNPAHLHVYDIKSGNLIAKIIIPSSKPSNVNSIRVYGDEELTITQKKLILKVLNAKDKKTGTPVWKTAIIVWDSLHYDD